MYSLVQHRTDVSVLRLTVVWITKSSMYNALPVQITTGGGVSNCMGIWLLAKAKPSQLKHPCVGIRYLTIALSSKRNIKRSLPYKRPSICFPSCWCHSTQNNNNCEWKAFMSWMSRYCQLCRIALDLIYIKKHLSKCRSKVLSAFTGSIVNNT